MEERSNGIVKEKPAKRAFGRPSVYQMNVSAAKKITLVIIIIITKR